MEVSIHATLTGGDVSFTFPLRLSVLFLSTPPSRVATYRRARSRLSAWFLSTPPSRVATVALYRDLRAERVSIHATLTGGDRREPGTAHPRRCCFYPRHPHGWRLPARALCGGLLAVSIHATLTGGDPHGMVLCRAGWGFYPRHPHGWRRFASSMPTSILLFLSTSPSRVATNGQDVVTEMEIVSIHATLTGGDNAPN